MDLRVLGLRLGKIEVQALSLLGSGLRIPGFCSACLLLPAVEQDEASGIYCTVLGSFRDCLLMAYPAKLCTFWSLHYEPF